MDLSGPWELQGVWNEIEQALAGQTFGRSLYNESGKVLMIVEAGDGAVALRKFTAAVGRYAFKTRNEPEADKQEEKRKVLQAFEEYLSSITA